ncbi:MAG: drug resistance transporter, EmrB/QacA subfamily [Myxococcales bacterium]|nr:drug resistance transporter, EmrB/QacA subfamily [Myxococcales bacterium]
MAMPAESLSLASARGRWVLSATILGSGLATLDGTIVNVALPTIGRDLHGGIAALQWIVTAYLLTLAAFLLLGGALSDRFGRRRIFLVGVVWFTAASVACGLAPSTAMLTAARALQGIGGALLTPGSLAIIEASFRKEDRAAAIGAWSGLGGVAVAVGPFLGGYLVQAWSWRLIFFINVPVALAVVLIASRHVPETRDPLAPRRLDFPGATLAALGLGGLTYALVEMPAHGARAVDVIAAGGLALVGLIAFFVVEQRRSAPMLELSLFRSRTFSAANAETFVVYAALGGAFFLLPIYLQQVLGYTPLASGAALLPTTAMMLLLSATMGRLAQRVGPRLPLTLGPLVAAAGLLLLERTGAGRSYWTTVLPSLVVFGLGLSMTVAPITATVLAAAPSGKAGLASAINNCVARTGSLIAVAMLPAASGLGPRSYLEPAVFAAGFRRGIFIAALLCAAGGILAWLTIRNGRPEE